MTMTTSGNGQETADSNVSQPVEDSDLVGRIIAITIGLLAGAAGLLYGMTNSN